MMACTPPCARRRCAGARHALPRAARPHACMMPHPMHARPHAHAGAELAPAMPLPTQLARMHAMMPRPMHARPDAHAGAELAPAMSFLMQLGFMRVGQPYPFEALEGADRDIAGHMMQLGLLMPFKPPPGAPLPPPAPAEFRREFLLGHACTKSHAGHTSTCSTGSRFQCRSRRAIWLRTEGVGSCGVHVPS
jgi:hypothetical protein